MKPFAFVRPPDLAGATKAVSEAPGAAFLGGGTNLIAWRDSKVKQGAFKCGTTPAWYPLGQEQIVIFDEQEHPQIPQTFPVSPQPPQSGIIPFPAETQSTLVGGATFPVPYKFGWLFLDRAGRQHTFVYQHAFAGGPAQLPVASG